MIQEQLVALLSGATAAGTRVDPALSQQGTAIPYIVYLRIAATPENVLSGSSGLVNTRMQIDVYGSTYAEAQAVAAAVDALMAGWSVQNVRISSQDLYEEGVDLHRVSADYSIWHT